MFFAGILGASAGFLPINQSVSIGIRVTGVSTVPVTETVPEAEGFYDSGIPLTSVSSEKIFD
jgi:hypothetical protein